MIPANPIPWHEANQRYLSVALAQVFATLETLSLPEKTKRKPDECSEHAATLSEQIEWPHPIPPALETLCTAFELSSFERNILLMCAGAEMDSRFAALYADINKDPLRRQPTFSMGLAALDDAHWSALTPGRPLRYWHLVEVAGGDTLATSPLRIQERVLHYLAGVRCLDERLQAMVKPISEPDELVASHRAIAERSLVRSRCSPGSASRRTLRGRNNKHAGGRCGRHRAGGSAVAQYRLVVPAAGRQ